MSNTEKMKAFRKANNCLRLMEMGARAYEKTFDEMMQVIKENGWEEEFWYYSARH